jgi:hypothetical protein
MRKILVLLLVISLFFPVTATAENFCPDGCPGEEICWEGECEIASEPPQILVVVFIPWLETGR